MTRPRSLCGESTAAQLIEVANTRGVRLPGMQKVAEAWEALGSMKLVGHIVMIIRDDG